MPAVLDQYQGLIIGFAALAAVYALNLVVYRGRWSSYPTREQYLAAHPGSATAQGVVCATCRQAVTSLSVGKSGRMYRCSWCDTDLYRVDAT